MSRRSIFLRWIFVSLVVLAGIITCLHLDLRDDALDLLPDGAVRGDISLLQGMGLVDRIFITLTVQDSSGRKPEQDKQTLQKSAEKLGNILQKSGRFSFVLSRLPKGYESELFRTLQSSLPLLLDGDDLRMLEKMTTKEGIEKSLHNTFVLLNSPAGIALKRQVQQDPLGLVPLVLKKLKYLQSEFSMGFDNGFLVSRDGKSCLLIAESTLPLTDSHVAENVDTLLTGAFESSLGKGIEARMIGTLPHTLANSRIVKNDLRLLLPLATILLITLLGLTLKNVRALVVLSVPFLAAPPAIAMTMAVFGEVSGLALGFGIVLLGIAVDFSIHLYLTLSKGEGSQKDLLKSVGKPVFFATLTTSAVFIVLFFSQVASHRQMATLALTGILLAVLFAWLLIPTIISGHLGGKTVARLKMLPNIQLSARWRGAILFAWLFLLLCGALSWPLLQYNGDLRVLDVADARVVQDENHFSATWGGKGDQAFVVAKGSTLEELLDRNSDVYTFLKDQGISTFQSFAPVLPGVAARKQNSDRWKTFWQQKRPKFDEQFLVAARAQGFTDRAFAPFFAMLDKGPALLTPSEFVRGSLQPMFASMLKMPSPHIAGAEDYLALTTVAVDGKVLPEFLSFASREPGIAILANSKWRAEVEHLLRRDIVTLSLAAGCVIVLLVGIQFRNIATVIAVLAPVLSALSAMSIFCYVTGGALNMMHLIMGIMVIGLSVDYGIFMVCSRLDSRRSVAVFAVSICAASSLIGFGVLSFASHPALHALGITVLVGIGVAWPVAIFVSPALLAYYEEKFSCAG